MIKLIKNNSKIIINSIEIDHLSQNQIKEFLGEHISELDSLNKELAFHKEKSLNLDTVLQNVNNKKLSDKEFRNFVNTFLD